MSAPKLNINGAEIELDPSKLSIRDGLAVEEFFGGTFDEWQQAVDKGSLKAVVAFLLVMGQKVKPDLTWDNIVDANVAEMYSSIVAEAAKPAKNKGGKVVHPTVRASAQR